MKFKILTALVMAAVMFLGGCKGKSDADLQKAAQEALTKNPKTAAAMVTVKDGVATVTGELADAEAVAAAGTAAKVEGIKEVKNDSKVKPMPAPVAASPDPTTKTAVEEGIKKAGVMGITVAVADGVVTLTGTVSKDNLPKVIMAANDAHPKKVENKLTIK